MRLRRRQRRSTKRLRWGRSPYYLLPMILPVAVLASLRLGGHLAGQSYALLSAQSAPVRVGLYYAQATETLEEPDPLAAEQIEDETEVEEQDPPVDERPETDADDHNPPADEPAQTDDDDPDPPSDQPPETSPEQPAPEEVDLP